MAEAADAEERNERETERVRHNMLWLEDKWAREGREHTNLASMMAAARGFSSEQMEDLSHVAGRGGGAQLGDGRDMPDLSPEQLTELGRGVHPSQIAGLEGGIDIEIPNFAAEAFRAGQPAQHEKIEL